MPFMTLVERNSRMAAWTRASETVVKERRFVELAFAGTWIRVESQWAECRLL
jgi:hypothetical protein